ncbi:hypothetical protein EJ04DRAFT_487350 [Polyplosphaeria fusca]|uniref:NACHT domain-containing protein n=1 Tax=Polyplosphaeria fusca TaxID=682080 RepID=A0A9P4V5T2_9PLEO|nr:hypothetical protein EJ04DRAFT_487350 [Polyplosphaeria fusca]
MDGLSGAASVIAVIDISAKVASLCLQYSVEVKHAKSDIERLHRKVNDTKIILEKLQQLLDKQGKTQLPTTNTLLDPLQRCSRELKKLEATLQAKLEPSGHHKAMQRIGLRALKWPLTSKEVEKTVQNLEKYGHTFSLSLQVDQVALAVRVGRKIDRLLLPTAIGASFDSHMEEYNSTCLPNTRTELLCHIQGWANERTGKAIFWLNGAAGTGKSTIARTIAQIFADKQELGASFFFKRGEGERRNATRFFTTIASQLALRVPELELGISKAIEADPAISEKCLKDQFDQLIFRPLKDVAHLPNLVLLIVIDALDECERDDDMRMILQLLSQTRGLKPVSLRILVTSRPELHIRLGFRRMPDGTYEGLVLHEISKTTIEHDIRVYLEHELTKTREERSLPLDWPGEECIHRLVHMAVPLFIFAATVCRFVGEHSGNPRRRLQDILEYETENVNKLSMTYLPILKSLFTTQEKKERTKLSGEFQEIVGSIVALENPLSINALARLLGKDKEDITSRLDSLHSVLDIPSRDDGSIRLLHLSFRDFLVDGSNKDEPFWVDESTRHKNLAIRCLELMEGLQQNMCSLQPGTSRDEIDEGNITSHLSPELQYACRYWVDHLEQSRQDITDGDATHLFLQKHFLHWLEVMSLMRESGRCVHLLNDLQALISSPRSIFSDFLRDAKRFILRFQPIVVDAPLQLYSSALTFAPDRSSVRQAFEKQGSQDIKLVSKREQDWDACRSTLEGHSGEVSAVAFSPDGKLAETGAHRSTLEGHSRVVSAVAFSPDGKLVQTNRGDIALPSPTMPSPLIPLPQPSRMFVEDQWISVDHQRLLWLPPEYRPACSAVNGQLVYLGHSSGRMSLLNLHVR